MTTSDHAQIRSLTTAELQRNVQESAAALLPNDLFVSMDELIQRGEVPANPASSLEQMVTALSVDQLNAIENNESEFSARSLHACIEVKQYKGVATLAWYYGVNNEQLGPVNRNELSLHAKNGVISPETLVWREGMADWVRAATINGLIPAKAAAAPPKAPTPPNVAPPMPSQATQPTYNQPQQQQQQQQYNQQPQYSNHYPTTPEVRRGAPGQLVAAGVIQFIAVPIWIFVGIIQMFSRRIDDDFLFGSLVFFLFIAGISIALGIGYLMVKRWSLYTKLITSVVVIGYMAYRMSIAYRSEEAWLIMIFFELVTLILVLSGWKRFHEEA